MIAANNVDRAVEKILVYLEDTNEEQGIYFDGWQGLGATAVLKTVAQRLTSAETTSPELKFDKIIHIDCSKWQNRRALQRKIIEELVIPEATNILDKQDDEDDFNGIYEGSRAENKDAARAISSFLMGKRFLVLFHNGSDQELSVTDMMSFGLPFYTPTYENKMLWTFRGRFRLSPKLQHKVQATDVFLYAQLHDLSLWLQLLFEESKQVALYTSMHGFNLNPATLADAVVMCCLYISKLNCIGSHIIEYDWTVHASNYWICDGIIDGEKDIAWKLAYSLHQEMWCEWDDPGLFYLMADTDRWVSTTYLDSSHYDSLAISAVDPRVSSFFLAAQQLPSDVQHLEYFGMRKFNRARFLRDYDGMFRHLEHLRVLKLSHCAFRFASPPFLCCQSLRFLGLDHCQDLNVAQEKDDVQYSWTCFQSLWVLDLCYTQLILSQEMIDHMDQIRELNVKGCDNMGEECQWPSNLYKLRVIKPTSVKVSFSFSNMKNMELLDLSGNTTMKAFPDLSTATSLKIVILDGCVALESINADSLPASLETFSLDFAAAAKSPTGAAAKISKISLRGCAQLRYLCLRGLPNLEELDLSGTSVKTVDLNIMQSPLLKRLFLLGCHSLRAIILWSNDATKLQLEEVKINTRQVDYPNGGRAQVTSFLVQVDDKLFQSHIVVTDARLLRSLDLFVRRMSHLHLHISATEAEDCSEPEGRCKKTDTSQHNIVNEEESTSRQFGRPAAVNRNSYNDISKGKLKVDVANIALVMWPCPQLPPPPRRQASCRLQVMSSSKLHGVYNNLAPFIDIADTLYVHDDLWITSIPGSNWGWLKWCRIERCPRLDYSVFTFDDYEGDELIAFSLLETFWASHLRTVQHIWSKGCRMHADSFKRLQHIHLESCPELIHVLPLSFNLPSLEKIEILHCGSLAQVFPLNTRYHKEILVTHGTTIDFPMLKCIHLHDLPSLQQICEAKIMSAPMLKHIRIRGCWNLKRLPAVPFGPERPKVDCEKDWWDNLEWDMLDASHRPIHYELHHARYYKKALRRGSLLR